MTFDRSRDAVPRLDLLESSPSTNSALAELVRAEDPPGFTTVLTLTQTAGRGRLGRAWIAPPGSSAAISVLVGIPDGFDPDGLGWLPLAAGVAMRDAVAGLLPDADVSVKWPNDVLVGGRKISGILTELVDARHVVVGAGLNVSIPTDALPVPTATSLGIEGASGDDLPDAAVAAYLRGLVALVTALLDTGGDAVESGLRERAVRVCSTLGREVRVELPGGEMVVGVAVGLDDAGRIEIATDAGRRAISAGDVIHLR